MNAAVLILYLCLGCLVNGQDQYEATCTINEDSGTPDQKIKGDIKFTQGKNEGEVTIKVSLTGFSTTDNLDEHGFHVHQNGELGDECRAAGGHYNPDGVTHGAPWDPATDRHVGDLGNVNETNGNVDVTFKDWLISIRPDDGNKKIIGKSIVVHATVDDLGRGNAVSSNTTGNAGGRLGCCIITDTTNAASFTHLSMAALLVLLTSILIL